MVRRGVLVFSAFAAAACGGGAPPKETTPPPAAPRVAQEEPEDENDGVSVVGTKGHMEPHDVEAGLAPHTAAMQECFTTRAARKRWLGGKLQLAWKITKAGVVTQVVIDQSDVGSWAIEKCVLELARQATFAKPKHGDADFSVPLDFEARGQIVWWEETVAQKAVGKRAADIKKKCDKAGAPGDAVTITVYVGTRGKVQAAGFASPAAIPDAWADCASKLIESWTLPDPRGKVAKLSLVHRS